MIDARGRIVAPGFIDIHTHSDTNLIVEPLAESKVRQGVTTEVLGNCGSFAAPYPDASLPTGPSERKWPTINAYLNALESSGVPPRHSPLQ